MKKQPKGTKGRRKKEMIKKSDGNLEAIEINARNTIGLVGLNLLGRLKDKTSQSGRT